MWNDDFFSPRTDKFVLKTSFGFITPLKQRESNANTPSNECPTTPKYDLNESISPLTSPPMTPLLKPAFLKKKRENEVIENPLFDLPPTPTMISPPQSVKIITLHDYLKTNKKIRKSVNNINTHNYNNNDSDKENVTPIVNRMAFSYEENSIDNNEIDDSNSENSGSFSENDDFSSPIRRSFFSPPVTPLLKPEFCKPLKNVYPSKKFAGSYSSPVPTTPDLEIGTFTPRMKIDESVSEEVYSSPLVSPLYPSPPRTPGLTFTRIFTPTSDTTQNSNTSQDSLTSPILPSPPISTPFLTPFYKTIPHDHHTTTFHNDSIVFEEEESRVKENCTKKSVAGLLSPQSDLTSYQVIKSWNLNSKDQNNLLSNLHEKDSELPKKEIDDRENLDLNLFSTFFRTGLPAQQLTQLHQVFRNGNNYSLNALCEKLPTLSSEVIQFLLDILTQKNVIKKTKKENVNYWTIAH